MRESSPTADTWQGANLPLPIFAVPKSRCNFPEALASPGVEAWPQAPPSHWPGRLRLAGTGQCMETCTCRHQARIIGFKFAEAGTVSQHKEGMLRHYGVRPADFRADYDNGRQSVIVFIVRSTIANQNSQAKVNLLFRLRLCLSALHEPCGEVNSIR